MVVSKEWLETKIKDLNEWLLEHEKGNHFEYAEKKHNRDYYVNQLIELEESGMQKILIYGK
jgi:hypothetical protein